MSKEESAMFRSYTDKAMDINHYNPLRVRHEAGEALGAIGTPECLPPLMQHADDPILEVQIAGEGDYVVQGRELL